MRTIQVRIAVLVCPSGEWRSAGGSDMVDELAAESAYDHLASEEAEGAIVRWIVADVPVPEPAPTEEIEGEVQDVG